MPKILAAEIQLFVINEAGELVRFFPAVVRGIPASHLQCEYAVVYQREGNLLRVYSLVAEERLLMGTIFLNNTLPSDAGPVVCDILAEAHEVGTITLTTSPLVLLELVG